MKTKLNYIIYIGNYNLTYFTEWFFNVSFLGQKRIAVSDYHPA